MLIEEVKEQNDKGNEFDVAKSVYSQLPFFTCVDVVKSADLQKDIERYLYCQQFGVQPYKGAYGDQPSSWVRNSFVIRKTLAKRESEQINGKRRKNTDKV